MISLNKKKLLVSLFVLIIVIVLGIFAFEYIKKDEKEIDFTRSEEAFFRHYYGDINDYRKDGSKYDSKLEELNAYYYYDGTEDYKANIFLGDFFFEAKISYNSYDPDEWEETSIMEYGSDGHLIHFINLDWESYEGVEDDYEYFLKAKKEGIHKHYTKEEIEECLKKYEKKYLEEN